MFLHSRHPEAHIDLVRILKDVANATNPNTPWKPRGVAHSFTGTLSEMEELINMGLYIGINGCSLKTEENLEVVKKLPLERIMLETDAPWCSITSTSAAARYLPKASTAKETKAGGKTKPNKTAKVNKTDNGTDTNKVTSTNTSTNRDRDTDTDTGTSPETENIYAPIPRTKTYQPSGTSGIKGRNEPGDVTTIAWVVAQIQGVEVEKVVDAAWKNTVEVFFAGKKGGDAE